MSPPISSTVKERVIQLHLEGKGRNEIAEILNSSHIRTSQGSATNAWKLEHGSSAPSQPHPETRPQDVSPIPPSPDDITGPGQSQEYVPLSIENAKGPEGLVTSDEVNLVNKVNLGLVNHACIQGSKKDKETTHVEVQEVPQAQPPEKVSRRYLPL
jgi:hypothetical protein